MPSYGLREVSKFNITNKIEITRTEKSSDIVGEIKPTGKEQKIDNTNFKIYDCNFYKQKNVDIIVDGTPHSEYQEINPFKVYYSSQKKLLIADIGLAICTPFFKYLTNSNPSLVSCSFINFDFIKIVRNKALVDQIWFRTSDVHAKTKSFNGKTVNKNKEAMKAITDGQATYIKVQIDVASNNKNLKRTVGFSKKSGIVILKTNDDTIDTLDKNLQLLMDTYKTYGSFK